jgi:hypothetical protein
LHRAYNDVPGVVASLEYGKLNIVSSKPIKYEFGRLKTTLNKILYVPTIYGAFVHLIEIL